MRWEIRLQNQDPLFVELPDDRDLAQEFQGITEHVRQMSWWSRRKVAPFWAVTEDHCVHLDLVAGVWVRPTKRNRQRMGFTATPGGL